MVAPIDHFILHGRNQKQSPKGGEGARGVCKKGVLKDFAKCTGKHRCQSLLFYKVAGFSKVFKKSFFTARLGVTASVFL